MSVGARTEFLAVYAGLTNEQYVDALNANTAGSLSAAERYALVAGLNGATETRASVLRKVAEDADFSGYSFWLAKLDQFGGDYRRAEMVKAFLSSTEYRSRFGQP